VYQLQSKHELVVANKKHARGIHENSMAEMMQSIGNRLDMYARNPNLAI